jgi:hypothetical protein
MSRTRTISRRSSRTPSPEDLEALGRARLVRLVAGQDGAVVPDAELPLLCGRRRADPHAEALQGLDERVPVVEDLVRAEVEHDEQDVGVPDEIHEPRLRVARERGQVHELEGDLVHVQDARRGRAGREGVVGHLGVRRRHVRDEPRLAGVGRPDDRDLRRSGPLDVVEGAAPGAALLLAAAGPELGDLLLDVRLELLRPLVLGDLGEHLAERGEPLPVALRRAVPLLGLEVLRCQVRRHAGRDDILARLAEEAGWRAPAWTRFSSSRSTLARFGRSTSRRAAPGGG